MPANLPPQYFEAERIYREAKTPEGSTLEDAAVAVPKSFLARLKYARVWGSGKHEGVMVKRDHVLQDGDIIELHV